MSVFQLPRIRLNNAGWSEVRALILTAETDEELTQRLNAFIADPDCNVLEYSEPRTAATFVAKPWHSTLSLQVKINPLNGQGGER